MCTVIATARAITTVYRVSGIIYIYIYNLLYDHQYNDNPIFGGKRSNRTSARAYYRLRAYKVKNYILLFALRAEKK